MSNAERIKMVKAAERKIQNAKKAMDRAFRLLDDANQDIADAGFSAEHRFELCRLKGDVIKLMSRIDRV
jgi:hypothetical protein